MMEIKTEMQFLLESLLWKADQNQELTMELIVSSVQEARSAYQQQFNNFQDLDERFKDI